MTLAREDAAGPDAAVPVAAVPNAAVPDAAVPVAAVPDATVPVAPGRVLRVQSQWASTAIAGRLQILSAARHELARISPQLVAAISPRLARTPADTYAAEVLPLLAACRFLEKRAAHVLKPRRLGRRGLPFWLAGVESTIERVPMGRILIIAPGNYPLFLAGVQALQALAAGNAVVWKPGLGGGPVAELLGEALDRAGLPAGLLRVTNDSVEAATQELAAHPDKIFFTGSAESGRAVLRLAAEAATPVVAELSGCDAVVVLPSADANRVVDALSFGMRLNGSATCMAPRRLVLVGSGHDALLERLQKRFEAMDAVDLDTRTAEKVRALLSEAEAQGAAVIGDAAGRSMKPVLVRCGDARLRVANADVFAPVLTVLHAEDTEDAVAQVQDSSFGLTVSVFGDERMARQLGARLDAGTVLINDLIVPTADPRVPFGGRRGSGFGTTRGAEGLLEMTAAKVVSVRKGASTRHYQQTGRAHEELFRGAVAMSHAGSWSERFEGLRSMVAAARKLK